LRHRDRRDRHRGEREGFFACHLAQMIGRRGKIYAFEPVPEIFAKLAYSVSRLGLTAWVKPIPAAVLDSSGLVQLSWPDRNSLEAQVTPRLNRRADHRLTWADAIPLDTFCALVGSRPSLVKIDAEGSEPAVLRGAAHLLASSEPQRSSLSLTQSRSLSAARMSTRSPQTSLGTSCITSMTSTKCFHSAKWWRTCGRLVGFATCLRCLGRMRRSAGGRRFPVKCGNGLLCDLRTRSTEQWLRQNCVTRGTCGLNVALVLTSSIQTRFSVTGLQLVPSARPNGVAMPRMGSPCHEFTD
jgi:FkbM family methyltransferase